MASVGEIQGILKEHEIIFPNVAGSEKAHVWFKMLKPFAAKTVRAAITSALRDAPDKFPTPYKILKLLEPSERSTAEAVTFSDRELLPMIQWYDRNGFIKVVYNDQKPITCAWERREHVHKIIGAYWVDGFKFDLGKPAADYIREYWGDAEYKKMLVDLLKEVAPDLEIDPTEPQSILKLCAQRGWIAAYQKWKWEQLKMIENLEAHPV